MGLNSPLGYKPSPDFQPHLEIIPVSLFTHVVLNSFALLQAGTPGGVIEGWEVGSKPSTELLTLHLHPSDMPANSLPPAAHFCSSDGEAGEGARILGHPPAPSQVHTDTQAKAAWAHLPGSPGRAPTAASPPAAARSSSSACRASSRAALAAWSMALAACVCLQSTEGPRQKGVPPTFSPPAPLLLQSLVLDRTPLGNTAHL